MISKFNGENIGLLGQIELYGGRMEITLDYLKKAVTEIQTAKDITDSPTLLAQSEKIATEINKIIKKFGKKK